MDSMLEEEPAENKLALCLLAAAAISGGAAGVRGWSRIASRRRHVACLLLVPQHYQPGPVKPRSRPAMSIPHTVRLPAPPAFSGLLAVRP